VLDLTKHILKSAYFIICRKRILCPQVTLTLLRARLRFEQSCLRGKKMWVVPGCRNC